jgi:hypothetical protein
MIFDISIGKRVGSDKWDESGKDDSGHGLLVAIYFFLQQFFLSKFLFWLCGTTSMLNFPLLRGTSTAEEALLVVI